MLLHPILHAVIFDVTLNLFASNMRSLWCSTFRYCNFWYFNYVLSLLTFSPHKYGPVLNNIIGGKRGVKVL